MSDFLAAYSIQNWLESCPQGYLEGTEYGHLPEENESEAILTNERLREEAIRTTMQANASSRLKRWTRRVTLRSSRAACWIWG